MKDKCIWEYDTGEEYFQNNLSCGNRFELMAVIEEDKFKFCPFCSREIKIK